MPDVDRIYAMADAALAAVVDGWPAEAQLLPEKQYVSAGLVIWDACEQLAVEVEGTAGAEADLATQTLIQNPAQAGWAMRYVRLAIWIIRCVHDISVAGDTLAVPNAVDIDADAQIILADAQATLNTLIAAVRAGTLGSCSGLLFDAWDAQGPEGGYGGGVLRVRLALY